MIHDADGNRLAEYEYDRATDTSTLLREYVWLNGEAVGVVENDTLYFVRSDHIGRPVFATDGTGTKVWEASYKPFGGVETSTGTPLELRFPGQWFQSESGLHQNWMRDYDPTTHLLHPEYTRPGSICAPMNCANQPEPAFFFGLSNKNVEICAGSSRSESAWNIRR